MAAYVASKHAVVGYSESLLHEMEARNAGVAVSVACPGMVDTRISTSERNWPARFGSLPEALQSRLSRLVQKNHHRALSKAMPASQAAEAIVAGMRKKQFWIFTDDVYAQQIIEHGDVTQTPAAPGYI
jgi:short-subunit dehydrogenase